MKLSILGVSCIRDRRRKPNEPFNPFAANANQVRQKKRLRRTGASNSNRIRELKDQIKRLEDQLVIPRLPKPKINLTYLDPPKSRAKPRQSVNVSASDSLRKKQEEARRRLGAQASASLRKKQEEARRRLGAQTTPAAPTTQKPAVQTSRANATADTQTVQRLSRADRLAELRKQSQESVKKNQSILDNHERTSHSSKPITVDQGEKNIPDDALNKQIEALLSKKAEYEKRMSNKKPKGKNHFRKKIREIEKQVEKLRNG